MGEKKIIVIMGASGSGKTLLGDYLTTLGIPKLVTNTTRKPRPGEIDGVHYNFNTEDEFIALPKVEYAKYSGNYYGLTKKEIEDKLSNHDAVYVVLELNGLLALKEMYPEQVLSVYLEVSLDQMYHRMKLRGDTLESIAGRISNAIVNGELDNRDSCIYSISSGTPEEVQDLMRFILYNEGYLTKSINR